MLKSGEYNAVGTLDKMKFGHCLSGPFRPIEFAFWCLVAVVIIASRFYASGGPEFGNDSYSYLSVAGNFTHGHPTYTSIITFDTERSHEIIPAPMTSFPLGFPAAMALLSMTGLKAKISGMLISAFSFLSILVLFKQLGNRLHLDGLSMRLLLVWYLGNAEFGKYSIAILSESLFALSTIAAIYCFAIGFDADSRNEHSLHYFIIANVLVGVSYWIRYAGLFLFLAEIIYFAWMILIRKYRKILNAGLGVMISASIIAWGLIRNYLLVGTWKGGNNKPGVHSIIKVFFHFLKLTYQLLAGEAKTPHHYYSWMILIALNLVFLGLIYYLVTLAIKAARHRMQVWDPFPEHIYKFSLVYLLTYSAVLIYLGHTSVISSGMRMYAPMLPLILLGMTITCARTRAYLDRHEDVRFTKILTLFSCAYLSLNLYAVLSTPHVERPHEIVNGVMAEEVAPGHTLGSWIAQNISSSDVLVTNRGATGYVLDRPTISLVLRQFSNQRWDEQAIKELMITYHAKYIILYADRDRLLDESRFLSDLVAGVSPAWLHLEVACRDAKIYRSVFPG